jgi:ATP/maltotriose-dependent transcriptional regulator MalT
VDSAESAVVGRHEECEVVRAALRRPDATMGGFVWITGPAGIGKSALARHLAAELAPFDVLRGVADHVTLRPFAALVDAFGTEVLPQVHAPLGAAVQVPAAVQVGDAVLRALSERASQAAAVGRPVVLVLDDLHRADDETLQVVEFVAAELQAEPVVVLATARPPAAGTALAASLHAASVVAHVELGPLGPAAVTELVRSVGADPTIADGPGVAAADGNPLLVLAAAAAGTAGLRPFVHRVLAELGSPASEVAQSVALLGEAVPLEEVAAVVGVGVEVAADAVDRAVVAGVCVVDRGLVRSRHDLVAAELVATISPAQRALLHRRAAEHLRTIDGPPHRLVAHAVACGASDADWVVTVIERVVAAEPLSALAMVDAVRPRVRDADVGRRLDLVRARALAATGRAAEATAAATALLEVVGDPAVRAVLHRELALTAIVESRAGDAAAHMTASLGLLDGEVARARARSELAVAFLVARDIPGAAEQAEAALAAAEAVRDPVALVGALEVVLFAAACRGRVDEVRALRRRLGALLTLSGVEAAMVYQPWMLSAIVDLDLGDTAVAATTATAGRSWADRIGTIWAVATYDAVSATASWGDGAFADAIAIARGARDGAAVSDPFGVGPWACGVMAAAAHELGEHDAALEAVERGAALLAVTGPTLGSERWALAAARVYLRRGRVDEARRLLEDWWALYEVLPSRLAQTWLAGDLAAVAVAMGDGARAVEVAATVRPFLASPVAVLAAQAAEAQCWAAAGGGAPAGGVSAEAVLGAADAWSAAPRGFAVAGLGRLASMALDERTGRLLRQRRDLLRRQLGLGEPSLAAQAGRPAVTGLASLTRSELDVARLVAEGWSNRDIAERLVVSRRTVESHMGAIYRKLAVTTRVQVANLVLESRP